MKTSQAFLFATMMVGACNQDGFTPGQQNQEIVLPSSDVLNSRVDDLFLAPLEAANIGLVSDPAPFQDTRQRIKELFQDELSADFDFPIAVLDAAQAVELIASGQNAFAASFVVQGVNVTVSVAPNQSGELDAVFTRDGTKFLEVQYDLFQTSALSTLFNSDGQVAFTVDFSRVADQESLVFASTENEFTVDVAADGSVFISRDKNGNGIIDQNFEFQAQINADLSGSLDAQIIFIGRLSICFNAQGKVDCE